MDVDIALASIAKAQDSDGDGAGYFSDSSFGLIPGFDADRKDRYHHHNRGQHHPIRGQELSDEEDEEQEESYFPNSQKQHRRQHSPPPLKIKKSSRGNNGRHDHRGSSRSVLEPLPLSFGGKSFDNQKNKNKHLDEMVNTRKQKTSKAKAPTDDLEALENVGKRNIDGDDNGGEANTKRVKQFKPFAVKYSKEEAQKFKNSMRKWVIPEVKFLANEEEAKKCMKIAVCMTNHYEEHGLNKLSEHELDLQIEEYYAKYGGECVRKFVNTQRNQLGQNLRKVVLRLHDEGRAFTAKQLEAVITRNPETLLKKPTVFKEDDPDAKEKAAKNKEVNDANKKYRARFLTYLDELIPATTPAGIWNEAQRSKHVLHGCQHLVLGVLKDVVPVEEEAMILVMLENNWEKWVWQAYIWRTYQMSPKQYLADVGYEEFHKQQPESKYSDAECGNNEFGGWEDEGVQRFAEARDTIKEARKNKECRKVEMQFQQLLERKYPGKTEKKPKAREAKAPTPRTSVAFGAGGAGRKKRGKGKASLHAVCDSDEEVRKMEALLNCDAKAGARKKKQEEKKGKAMAKKAKAAKRKGVTANADEDESSVDQDQVIAAMESSEEEDDDLIGRAPNPKKTQPSDSQSKAAEADAAAAKEGGDDE